MARRENDGWPAELEGYAPTESARPSSLPDDAPDARILALDIGLYGHIGGMTSIFWWSQGGILAAHESMLFQPDDSLLDQLDMLEIWAEQYPEYRWLPPVVVVGTTVLSPYGRQRVRHHLNEWASPPWYRRLINVGDYAGEQAGNQSTVSRKKLRDILAMTMAEDRLRLTDGQRSAITIYTGKRERPGRDPDADEWRYDETDAVSLPVAHACYAARYLLPSPEESQDQTAARIARYARAWQIELPAISDDDALDRAWTYGHPSDSIDHPEAHDEDSDDLMRPIGAMASWRADI